MINPAIRRRQGKLQGDRCLLPALSERRTSPVLRATESDHWTIHVSIVCSELPVGLSAFYSIHDLNLSTPEACKVDALLLNCPCPWQCWRTSALKIKTKICACWEKGSTGTKGGYCCLRYQVDHSPRRAKQIPYSCVVVRVSD